jgi:RNA polymerase-interacting CarD/CdnL/TRCF family regulator
MFESLKDIAKDKSHERKEYYRLAYQTVREKVDLPKEQFHTLILRLLGDKDHDKILDIVSKVEKNFQKQAIRRQ